MTDHPLLGNNYKFDQETGRFINAAHQRIATIIHEYDPRLALAWIPPEDRDEVDVFPYVVIYYDDDGSVSPVFYLQESELDERVLERIFLNDIRRRGADTIWSEMQAKQAAQDLLEAKKMQDEQDEKWEFGKWALQTRLNTFKHNGKVWRD